MMNSAIDITRSALQPAGYSQLGLRRLIKPSNVALTAALGARAYAELEAATCTGDQTPCAVWRALSIRALLSRVRRRLNPVVESVVFGRH